ncbi:MAG: hypothetical protein HN742_33945 [Lentisphaerae bacterium]|jgi:hypothetical protein|nr:hypothetical protein [Lentisphaerota bacterium]MBT4817313.1 hypothetical protein [Lentisphaerota bacterium]MBT5611467.1 hypothetical protein [Lentisphaerota bacterium]MBT7061016.1 hypothetical protein [Lentisphaerota bacterium]MBT7846924.1 hypothetical protein [Lentisphaerota bacterium]
MTGDKGKKRGPLFWGLVAAAGVVLLAGICVIGVASWARSAVLNATQEQAVAVPVAGQVEKRELRRLNDKYTSFRKALDQGHAGTFEFSDRELNVLVAKLPELKELRGKAAFAIERGEFIVDACVPLNDLPGLEGRYLNGRFTLDISTEGGHPVIRPVQVTVPDGEVPQVIVKRLREMNVLDELTERDANARTLVDRISGLKIRDGKLVIDTAPK